MRKLPIFIRIYIQQSFIHIYYHLVPLIDEK